LGSNKDTKYHCFICGAKMKPVRNHHHGKILNLGERQPDQITCPRHKAIARHKFKIIEIKTFDSNGNCTETLRGTALNPHLI
jgi:hypothetical protein